MSSDDRLDLVFHALSDRTRRAILRRLARGPVMVTRLAKPFDMSLAAVSKHVKLLERARLVSRTIDGRVHRCALRGVGLRDAEAWLVHYRGFWDSTLDSLAHFVEDER